MSPRFLIGDVAACRAMVAHQETDADLHFNDEELVSGDESDQDDHHDEEQPDDCDNPECQPAAGEVKKRRKRRVTRHAQRAKARQLAKLRAEGPHKIPIEEEQLVVPVPDWEPYLPAKIPESLNPVVRSKNLPLKIQPLSGKEFAPSPPAKISIYEPKLPLSLPVMLPEKSYECNDAAVRLFP
eukprot:TRINITY_DN32311_c0_g1_i1.p1 TRINITY_DN32311_c0_g1~~TRINITY_DN32311_c0_g1_i1.p1  ORF type:complete len:183 (+),score=36.82 TRINITY_DN32311_c0_g1_i1:88-636(+)